MSRKARPDGFIYKDVPVHLLAIETYDEWFEEINHSGRYDHYTVDVQYNLFDPFSAEVTIFAYKKRRRRRNAKV